MLQLQSALGVVALLAIAWAISEHRRQVAWRPVLTGLALTVLLAFVLIKVPRVTETLAVVNRAVGAIGDATKAGTSFVFGYLGGGTLPYELKVPGAEFVLALQALPILLVMSALTTLLFYWRVLPPIVRGFSWILQRTIGVGGAVGLSTAAHLFLGLVGAALFIWAHLRPLSVHQLV